MERLIVIRRWAKHDPLPDGASNTAENRVICVHVWTNGHEEMVLQSTMAAEKYAEDNHMVFTCLLP